MKTYYTQMNVGNARYVVNFHNGESFHKDGSPFFDIRIFKNKKKMDNFIKDLEQQGYKIK